MSILRNKVILVTGGTGSFGKKFVEIAFKEHKPQKIIIYSRDEYKQYEMQKQFFEYDQQIRYFIGDVRDKERLSMAMAGVDFVIHAAALKQVPAMEYNPAEAVKTNVLGAMNLINCAIEHNVEKVIALSTDKACNPINLYGATKLCSDKLFIAGNHYVGKKRTRFSVTRYGNVIGSRGSVIPKFIEQRKSGYISITDPLMTRFWITLEQGVEFVIRNFSRMRGGEIFVPKIPSMNIADLAKAIGGKCKIRIVGIRPGEKLHEVMISEDDCRNALEVDDCYIVKPSFQWWDKNNHITGKAVPAGFSYRSDTNKEWLTAKELKTLIKDFVE